MDRFCLAFLFIAFSATLSAQPGFNKIYSNYSGVDNFSRLMVGNDTIICIGVAYDTTILPTPLQVLMVKMDSLGNVINYHLLKDSLNDFLSMDFLWGNIFKTSQGNYAFPAVALNRGGYLLIQIDSNLQVRSIFEFQSPDDYTAFDETILELSDGGFFISGAISRPNLKQDGFIRRIDKSGNVLWFKYYGDYNKDETFFSMVKVDDNRFVCGGSAGPNTNDGETSRAGLWVIDSNGVVLNTWLGPDEPNLITIRGLLLASDGGFIAHGRTYRGEGQWGSKVQISLMKFDSTLEIQWMKHIGPASSNYNGIYDMTKTPDGHYIVAGQRTAYGDLTQPSDDWGGWLYKFSEQGDSIWSRADNAPEPYTPTGEYAYGGVGLLSSGSVVAGGIGNVEGKFTGWVVKVTADGCLDTIFCNSVPVIQSENEQVELTIAPNPAHSFVTLLLESEGSGNKPVRFSVFNALGQEVWTLTSGAGRQEISLAGWPPGVYVARAEWERGAAVKTFVKE